MELNLTKIVEEMGIFLKVHMSTLDDAAAYYETEKARIERKYSKEEAERRFVELDNEVRHKMNESREKNKAHVLEFTEAMKDLVKGWISKPIDPELMSTLNTFIALDMELTQDEILVFAERAKDDYFSMKVLAKIDKMGLLTAPDAQTIFEAIKGVENLALLGLDTYCGQEYQLLGLLPNRVWKNVDYGRHDTVSVSGSTTALKKVLERGEALERLAAVSITLPDDNEDEEMEA